MIDIQTAFLRVVVPPRRWDYVSLLRVIPQDADLRVTDVYMGGRKVPFIQNVVGEVMAFPEISPGAGTQGLRLEYQDEEGNFAGSETKEPLPPSVEETSSGDVKILDTALYVELPSWSKVTEVYTDGSPREFVVVNETQGYVLLDQSTPLVKNLTVIGDSTRFTDTSAFEYTLGTSAPRGIQGRLKATGQLVKALLTTPGTNAFNRNAAAAGLGNLRGLRVARSDEGSLVALVVGRIQSAAAQLIINHATSSLPESERLVRVDVISVQREQSNNARLRVALSIGFLDGVTAQFGFLANSVEGLIGSRG